jgi:hypothetical protein
LPGKGASFFIDGQKFIDVDREFLARYSGFNAFCFGANNVDV